ncbi:MAG: hypothetical protein EON96_13055 [Caulobacteraceae bacterium]|nr:MAG: hypothetical protein EON96_13055 [Caulobacteraceae bacterium]
MSFDLGERVRPDHQEFLQSVRLAAIATVSAVLTATLVIGAGRALLPSQDTAAPASTPFVLVADRY